MGNGGKLGRSTYYDVTYKYDTVYTYPQSLFEKESEQNGTTSYHFTNWYSKAGMAGISYEVGEQFQNLTDIDCVAQTNKSNNENSSLNQL